jgi:hypothetical protein
MRLSSGAAGLPKPVLQPFPPELKRIDIGSYHTDISRIRRDLGWTPGVEFNRGIRRSIEFYRKELPHYLNAADYQPAVPGWTPVAPHALAV